MRKIFRLVPDTDFRFIYPDDESMRSLELWQPTGQKRAPELMNFSAHFSKQDNSPVPDISYINQSAFAFKEPVANELCALLEASGELLPFYVDEVLWYSYNVTRLIKDIIDISNTVFAVPELQLDIIKPAFFEDKLPKRSCIFKVPQGRMVDTFCFASTEGDKNTLMNLFAAVSAHGYTGMKFEEVASF